MIRQRRYPPRWNPVSGARELRARSSFLSIRSATVHPTARVARGSILTSRTTIGPYTRINGPCTVRDLGEFAIGNWNAIGSLLHVVTANHPMSFANVVLKLDGHLGLPRPADTRGGTSIGNACWIGDRVTLLAGSRVGNGAVVGAGAVVTTSIPPFSVALGVPARVSRERFAPEIVEVLLGLAWWDWPIDRIVRNRSFFALDLTVTPPATVAGSVVP